MAVTKKGGLSEALTELLGAALTLPGISGHASEQGFRSEKVNISYHRTEYTESDD